MQTCSTSGRERICNMDELKEVMDFLGIPEEQREIRPPSKGRGQRFHKMSSENIGKLLSELAKRSKQKPHFSHDGSMVEFNWIRQRRMAEEALLHYNQTQGADFELLEVVSASHGSHLGQYAYHLNFTAKPKDGFDGSSKRFFAELCYIRGGPKGICTRVNLCMMLDPLNSDVINGCAVCTDEMLHPKGVKLFYRPPQLLVNSQPKDTGEVAGDVCGTCGRAYDNIPSESDKMSL